MKKNRIEFIKRAHGEACTDWKDAIEAEFPKIFPPPPPRELPGIKDWYVIQTSNGKQMTVFIQGWGSENNYFRAYGWATDGAWVNPSGTLDWGFHNKDTKWRKANNDEIRRLLEIEERKRGYDKAGSFCCLVHLKVLDTKERARLLNEGEVKAWNNYGCYFDDGTWAVLIKDIDQGDLEYECDHVVGEVERWGHHATGMTFNVDIEIIRDFKGMRLVTTKE